MLADEGWLAYQKNNSAGKLAIFYASPSKKGRDGRIEEMLFCVARGTLPRSIVAAGTITAQQVLHQDEAFLNYCCSTRGCRFS